MSSTMESRAAAAFTSQPQVVEVHHAGGWRAGELLGWRHDEAGACRMWVRVVVDGSERTAWTDLAAVRLPEPASARVDPATQAMTGPAQGAASRPAAGRTGGRRRAPEAAQAPAAPASAAPAPVAPTGRHRAPATAPAPAVGRHRAADTDHLPAVVAGGPTSARGGRSGAWAVPAARGAHPVERRPAGHGWTAPEGLEPDLLTRPMRLADHIPHARRPRLDGAVHA